MPRSTREAAAQNREAIVLAASRRLRERGPGGVSVPALMAEAGMTHGGFYKHFPSMDALEAEACGRALEEMAERVWALVETDGAGAWQALIDFYLSPAHCGDTGAGCAIAALAADAARTDRPVGQTLADGVERQIEILAALSDREKAITTFSTLIGAVLLSRATAGRPVSEEILAVTGAQLG